MDINSKFTWLHKSAGEFSMISQITGGKQEPFPPIMENPKPNLLLLPSKTSFSYISIAANRVCYHFGQILAFNKLFFSSFVPAVIVTLITALCLCTERAA